MAEKTSEKALQEKIRQDLEGLLGDDVKSTLTTTKKSGFTPETGELGGDISIGAKMVHPYAQPTDFHKKKMEATIDARKTLKSLVNFYLGSKIIQKNEYTKYKKRVDEMSLANMMFAIDTSQYAIIRLLEEIDLGGTHPRHFEALATLNAQMMNMIKHQQSLFVTMEEGYKKIKSDHQTIEAEDKTEDVDATVEGEVTVINGSFKSRGTKMLMQNLHKTVELKETTKGTRLTDARNRPDSVMKIEVKKTSDEDDAYDNIDEFI